VGADVQVKQGLDLLPPSDSAPAGVPVPSKKVRRLRRPKDVERRAQRVFGSDPFRSDFTWNCFGYWAGLHHLFGPLRKPIQALARRYRRRPLVLESKLRALVERDWQKRAATDPSFQCNLIRFLAYADALGVKFEGAGSVRQPFRLPYDLSGKKQLDALSRLLPVFSSMFAGVIPRVQPKELLRAFRQLTAERPGPPAGDVSEAIRALDREAQAQGRRVSNGAMAAKVFPPYSRSDDGDEKRRLREVVRLVRRRSKPTG